MKPSNKFQQLQGKNRRKRTSRTIIYTVIGLFLALFLYAIYIEIQNEKISDNKEYEKAQEDEEMYAVDQEYITWFEDHNQRFHERLAAYEQSVRDDWNSIPETRENLYQVLRGARGQEVSNSHFDEVHSDYQQAMFEFDSALKEKPDSNEQNEKLEYAKTLETEVLETFNERKESVNEDN